MAGKKAQNAEKAARKARRFRERARRQRTDPFNENRTNGHPDTNLERRREDRPEHTAPPESARFDAELRIVGLSFRACLFGVDRGWIHRSGRDEVGPIAPHRQAPAGAPIALATSLAGPSAASASSEPSSVVSSRQSVPAAHDRTAAPAASAAADSACRQRRSSWRPLSANSHPRSGL